MHVESVLELPGDGGFHPTAVVDPHVIIHGVEVWALSAPRCRSPHYFFLSSTTAWNLFVFTTHAVY